MANFFNKAPTGPKPKPITPHKIKTSPTSSTLYPGLLELSEPDFFFFAILYSPYSLYIIKKKIANFFTLFYNPSFVLVSQILEFYDEFFS